MRTAAVLGLTIALMAPLASRAADASAEIRGLVGAYQHVAAVRVIEKFENGALATVDVIPPAQYRIATTGGQDPAFIMRLATSPVDGAEYKASYSITGVGSKTIDGAHTNGYRIISPDRTYDATVWINEYHLPVYTHVVTDGHSVDITYGDYNDAALASSP